MGDDSSWDENSGLCGSTELGNPGNHGILEPSRVGKTSELNSNAAKATNPQMPHPTGLSCSRDRRREQQKWECASIPIGFVGAAGCGSWICLENKSHPRTGFSLR